MAKLSLDEFEALIETLVSAHGLGKVQQHLLRLNALVSRRRLGSSQALARALYPLTVGLERDANATRVVLALWEEFLGSKLDEESSKRLEEVAEKINACLTDRQEIDPEKESELREQLDEYRRRLGEKVGETAAHLTMLNRALPGVARLLRAT